MSLIPGKHRFSLHAIYLEHGGKKVERNDIAPEHFQGWMDWAAAKGHRPGLQPHVLLASEGGRRLHAEPSRRGHPPLLGRARHRLPQDRRGLRPPAGHALRDQRLDSRRLQGPDDRPQGAARDPRRSRWTNSSPRRSIRSCNLDAVESKLFGIGSETYVVGSHEFYLGYAVANKKLLTLDAGHFHPTETIADKISSSLMFLDEILLHVSRGVRWDSDHVVILSDELRAIAEEIVRGGFLDRVHLGLDFFDASINRVAAWVIGARSMLKALLLALLEPTAKLRELEIKGDFTSRLALLEEIKTLPFGAVWDYYCQQSGVPVGPAWLDVVKQYEAEVTGKTLELRIRQMDA